MQGHLQAWALIPAVWRSKVPNKTFLDLMYVLLAPGLMLLSSVVFAVAPVLLLWTLATGGFDLGSPSVLAFLVAVYLLMFGPALYYGWAYCPARRRGVAAAGPRRRAPDAALHVHVVRRRLARAHPARAAAAELGQDGPTGRRAASGSPEPVLADAGRHRREAASR